MEERGEKGRRRGENTRAWLGWRTICGALQVEAGNQALIVKVELGLFKDDIVARQQFTLCEALARREQRGKDG